MLCAVVTFVVRCHCLYCCPADGEGQYVVDSVSWLGPRSLAASGLWYDAASNSEGYDAYTLAITWGSWAGTEGTAPQGLEGKQTAFVSLPVSTCVGGGVWATDRGEERHRQGQQQCW